MNKFNYLILFFSLIVISCNNPLYTKKEAEEKAIKITEILSEINIGVFKEW